MSEQGTESLLRELAQDLAPVRRLPSLRVAGAATLAAFLAALGLAVAFGSALPGRAGGVPLGEGAYLLMLAGMLVAADGALLAALAGAVPGREAAARWGRGLAAVGAAGVAMGATWWLLRVAPLEASLPLGSSLGCTLHAVALGVAPGAMIGWFLARALDRRRLAGATLASVGVVGLGAAAVHASCADGGTLHVVVGHCAAPLLVGLLLALPLALWLGWRRATGSS